MCFLQNDPQFAQWHVLIRRSRGLFIHLLSCHTHTTGHAMLHKQSNNLELPEAVLLSISDSEITFISGYHIRKVGKEVEGKTFSLADIF